MKKIKLLPLTLSTALLSVAPFTLSLSSCNSPEKTAEISKIVVESLPEKSEYILKQKLDLSGLKVIGEYTDGSFKEVPLSNIESEPAEGTAFTEIGTQTISIKLKDSELSTQFNIFVRNPQVTGIAIKQLPNKTEYLYGERLQLDGLKIKCLLDDGTEEEAPYYDFVTQPMENERVNSFKTEIKVKSLKGDFQTSFNITVNEDKVEDLIVTQLPDKVKYNVGDTFDISGIKLSTVTTGGSTSEIDISKLKVEPELTTVDKTTKINISIPDTNISLNTYVVVPNTSPVKIDKASWDDLIAWSYLYEAGKVTEAELCAQFLQSDGTAITELSQFIGQEKSIMNFGNTQNEEIWFKIIDINHDTITDDIESSSSSHSLFNGKKALFTFEISTLLEYEKYPIFSQWNSNFTNWNFACSQLFRNLNSNDESLIHWLNKDEMELDVKKPAIQMFPSDFPVQSIHKICKHVWTYDPETGSYLFPRDGYAAKLFPLTFTEITKFQPIQCGIEGTTYKYYELKDTESQEAGDEARVKATKIGIPFRYNLASPIYDSARDGMASVGEDGSVTPGNVFNCNAVTFAFCL